MFDRLKAEYDAMVAAKEPSPIKVTLPDGKEVEGKSWRTTPLDIASSIRFGGLKYSQCCRELWSRGRRKRMRSEWEGEGGRG